MRSIVILLFVGCGLALAAYGEKTSAPIAEQVPPAKLFQYPRPVENWLEAQIALARQAISSGSIDGVGGHQTAAALRAFQERAGLEQTGYLDNATKRRLVLNTAPFKTIVLSAEDLAELQPLGKTWLAKSQQSALAYETALEMVAEQTHAHPNLLKRLNPGVDWDRLVPGIKLLVPSVERTVTLAQPAQIHISLGEKTLEARDEAGNLIVHCPVSIARLAEKRPEGELHVTVVIPDPDYTFDPETFPESPEARELGRKLILPPGPNNPVGVAWIGLDRTGYGIHGTPTPEQVGRTESHGCFRLANWDARMMLEIVWVGMPVLVDP